MSLAVRLLREYVRNETMTEDTEPHGNDPIEDEPTLPDNEPVDDPELVEIEKEEDALA